VNHLPSFKVIGTTTTVTIYSTTYVSVPRVALPR